MRRIVLLALIAVEAAACERVDIDYEGGGGKKTGPIVAVAVEYPEGCDWRRGWGGDSARLVVYSDWQRLLSVDVGEENFVSAEPDMHRLIGGELYTEYSVSDQTIIGRNGKELFRYGGSEAIADMAVVDSSVFTLGIRRNGGGFVYRRSGISLLLQEKGVLLSKFHFDGGKLCFSYKLPLGTEYRYYLVRDGNHEQVVTPSDMKEITSMRLWNGEVNYLGLSSAVNAPVWQVGPDPFVLEDDRAIGQKACTFMVVGGELYAHTNCSIPFGETGSALWKRDTLKYLTGSDGSIYSVCGNAEVPCFVCTRGGRASPVTLVCGQMRDTIPSALDMISPDAFCYGSGACYLGLNDRENGNVPVVMHGTDTVRFGFNGYFTCFSPQ